MDADSNSDDSQEYKEHASKSDKTTNHSNIEGAVLEKIHVASSSDQAASNLVSFQGNTEKDAADGDQTATQSKSSNPVFSKVLQYLGLVKKTNEDENTGEKDLDKVETVSTSRNKQKEKVTVTKRKLIVVKKEDTPLDIRANSDKLNHLDIRNQKTQKHAEGMGTVGQQDTEVTVICCPVSLLLQHKNHVNVTLKIGDKNDYSITCCHCAFNISDPYTMLKHLQEMHKIQGYLDKLLNLNSNYLGCMTLPVCVTIAGVPELPNGLSDMENGIIRFNNSGIPRLSYVCRLCNLNFHTARGLSAHHQYFMRCMQPKDEQDYYEKTYSCKLCPMQFMNFVDFYAHHKWMRLSKDLFLPTEVDNIKKKFGVVNETRQMIARLEAPSMPRLAVKGSSADDTIADIGWGCKTVAPADQSNQYQIPPLEENLGLTSLVECNITNKSVQDKTDSVKDTELNLMSKMQSQKGDVALSRMAEYASTEFMYVCGICKKTFPRLSQIQGHMGSHVKQHQRVPANVMVQSTTLVSSGSDKLSGDQHITEEPKDIEYQCGTCSMTFPKLTLMQTHMEFHKKQLAENLPKVDKAIIERKQSLPLFEMVTLMSLTCDICYKSFPSEQKLWDHRITHYPTKEPTDDEEADVNVHSVSSAADGGKTDNRKEDTVQLCKRHTSKDEIPPIGNRRTRNSSVRASTKEHPTKSQQQEDKTAKHLALIKKADNLETRENAHTSRNETTEAKSAKGHTRLTVKDISTQQKSTRIKHLSTEYNQVNSKDDATSESLSKKGENHSKNATMGVRQSGPMTMRARNGSTTTTEKKIAENRTTVTTQLTIQCLDTSCSRIMLVNTNTNTVNFQEGNYGISVEKKDDKSTSETSTTNDHGRLYEHGKQNTLVLNSANMLEPTCKFVDNSSTTFPLHSNNSDNSPDQLLTMQYRQVYVEAVKHAKPTCKTTKHIEATKPLNSETVQPPTQPTYTAANKPYVATAKPLTENGKSIISTQPPIESNQSLNDATQHPIEAMQPPNKAAQPPVEAAHSPVEASPPSVKALQPTVEATEPPVEAAQPPNEAVAAVQLTIEVAQSTKPSIEAQIPTKAARPIETAEASIKVAELPIEAPQPCIEDAIPSKEIPQPPVEAAEPPVEAIQLPMKSTRPAIEAAELPVKVAQPPTEATLPCIEVTVPPAEAAPPPTDVAQPPSEVAQPPTDVAQPPSEVAQPPTDVAQPPSEVAQPPTDVAQPPSEVAQPLTDATHSPTEATGPPIEAEIPPHTEITHPPIETAKPVEAVQPPEEATQPIESAKPPIEADRPIHMEATVTIKTHFEANKPHIKTFNLDFSETKEGPTISAEDNLTVNVNSPLAFQVNPKSSMNEVTRESSVETSSRRHAETMKASSDDGVSALNQSEVSITSDIVSSEQTSFLENKSSENYLLRDQTFTMKSLDLSDCCLEGIQRAGMNKSVVEVSDAKSLVETKQTEIQENEITTISSLFSATTSTDNSKATNSTATSKVSDDGDATAGNSHLDITRQASDFSSVQMTVGCDVTQAIIQQDGIEALSKSSQAIERRETPPMDCSILTDMSTVRRSLPVEQSNNNSLTQKLTEPQVTNFSVHKNETVDENNDCNKNSVLSVQIDDTDLLKAKSQEMDWLIEGVTDNSKSIPDTNLTNEMVSLDWMVTDGTKNSTKMSVIGKDEEAEVKRPVNYDIPLDYSTTGTELIESRKNKLTIDGFTAYQTNVLVQSLNGKPFTSKENVPLKDLLPSQNINQDKGNTVTITESTLLDLNMKDQIASLKNELSHDQSKGAANSSVWSSSENTEQLRSNRNKPISSEQLGAKPLNKGTVPTNPQHKKTGKLSHICNVCNRSFRLAKQLNGHKVVHWKASVINQSVTGCKNLNNFTTSASTTCTKGKDVAAATMKHKSSVDPSCGKEESQNIPAEATIGDADLTGKFYCPYCPRAFDKIHQRSAHMRVHRNRKAIPKPTASQEQAGNVHCSRSHFRCTVCLEYFPDWITLCDHRRTHKMSELEKDTAFSKPPKVIASVQSLKYTCDICSKSFSQSGRFKSHVNAHRKIVSGATIAGSYGCEICNETFTKSQQRARHYRKHAREKKRELQKKKVELQESDHSYCSKKLIITRLMASQAIDKQLKGMGKITTVTSNVPTTTADGNSTNEVPTTLIAGGALTISTDGYATTSTDGILTTSPKPPNEQVLMTQSNGGVSIILASTTTVEESSTIPSLKSSMHIGVFDCHLCDKSYTKQHQLAGHMRAHRQNKCLTCGARFSLRRKLAKHMKTHAHSKVICEFVDTSKRRCIAENVDTTESQSKLPVLSMNAYESKSILHSKNRISLLHRIIRMYLYGAKPKRRRVKSVQRWFKPKRSLQRALSKCRQDKIQKILSVLRKSVILEIDADTEKCVYECKVCRKSTFCHKTVLRHYLANHIEDDETKENKIASSVVLPQTKKPTKDDDVLKGSGHQRFRNKSKISCPICKGSSGFQCHLHNQEELSYADEQDNAQIAVSQFFPCQQCGKKFSNRDKLAEHCKCHLTMGQIQYCCPSCKFSTMSIDDLASHLNVHKGDKNQVASSMLKQPPCENVKRSTTVPLKNCYTCHICQKFFYNVVSFQKHLKSHMMIYQFKCTHCTSTFAYAEQLWDHIIANHSPLNPSMYTCTSSGSQSLQNIDTPQKDKKKEEISRRAVSSKGKSISPNQGKKISSKSPTVEVQSEKTLSKAHVKPNGTTRVPSSLDEYFACSQCKNFQASSKEEWIQHTELVHNRKQQMKFRCGICSYHTSKPESMANHRKLHGRLTLQCDTCQFRCQDRLRMMRHVQTVHKQYKPHKCKLCAYTTAYRHHLKRHSEQHKNPLFRSRYRKQRKAGDWHIVEADKGGKRERIVCMECGKGFYTKKTHRHHQIHVHGMGSSIIQLNEATQHQFLIGNLRPDEDQPRPGQQVFISPARPEIDNDLNGKLLVCSTCSMMFKHQYTLQQHTAMFHPEQNKVVADERAPSPPCQCPQCGLVTGSAQLQSHMMMHEEEDLLFCKEEGCHFKTAEAVYFKRHQAKHTPQKEAPNTCRICQMCFPDASSLNLHTVQCHEKPARCVSSKAPYMCANCPFTTSNEKDANRHLKLHNYNLAFKCDFCIFSTSTASAIATHQKIHRHPRRNPTMTPLVAKNAVNHQKMSTRSPVKSSEASGSTLCDPPTTPSHSKHVFVSSTGLKLYECRYCQRFFDVAEAWQRHEIRHMTAWPQF